MSDEEIYGLFDEKGFRVQLIGGRFDGDTNLITKVIPRISVTDIKKKHIYVVSGSYSSSGEILYVHEDIFSAWRKQHISC